MKYIFPRRLAEGERHDLDGWVQAGRQEGEGGGGVPHPTALAKQEAETVGGLQGGRELSREPMAVRDEERGRCCSSAGKRKMGHGN